MKMASWSITQGAFTLNIPIVKIGRGKPKVLIMSGLHGDEATGLVIIQELLQRLESEKIKGSLTIIPTVNILGRAANSREETLGGKDLNRIIGKTERGTLTAKLIERLLTACRAHDLVIDIHTMMTYSPIVAIFMNSGSAGVKTKSRRAIARFQPNVIWRLSPQKKEEIEYSGSLGPNLALSGVANFAIEAPKPETLTSEQLSQTVEGLLRILKNRRAPKGKLPEVERVAVKARTAGLFLPQVDISAKIGKGQTLGKLILPDLEEEKIKAPISGVLLSHIGKEQIKEGDELLSIGKQLR